MRRRLLVSLLAVLLIGGVFGTVALLRGKDHERVACAGGRDADHDAEARGESEDPDAHAGAGSENGLFAGPGEIESPCGDEPGHPESFGDLAKANSSIVSRSVAPGTAIKAGAYRSAIRERAAIARAGNAWKPVGTPPLISYRTDYDTTRGSTSEGLGDLSGRVTALAAGPGGTVYAAASNGGVWKSTDGQSWASVSDSLPTQVIAGVATTTAGGGRLLVLTGDNAFGGDTYAGLGAYYSGDGGATYQHATGIPDGVLAFRLAVDPTDPQKVYAATGGGLYRSTDGGATYANVNLPTGANAPSGTPDCTGKPTTAKDCFLANVVTDVTVQGPSNAQTPGAKPGAVLAAVGWRAGTKPNADGAQQSPGNGLYESDTGAAGTFNNLAFAAHANTGPDPLTQARIGRIALGEAAGPGQNHRVVYAIVQDAVKFNGGVVGLDVNENGTTSAAQSDYLNAVWVSTDFGATWKELEGSSVIDSDATSGSALAPPVCKTPAVLSYCPGVQAWYNLWVSPDPTTQTATGIPKRLAFGLEEVWSNTDPVSQAAGLDGSLPVKFGVVGRYYAGATCTPLNATNGLPVCPVAPAGVPAYTTHPDQHGALWVPDGNGGVTLFVGNDGGVYKQHVDAGAQFSNDNWGQGKPMNHSGANDGLRTLQPYDAAMAKDGTLYMGLQDNGEAKIDPDGTMYTVFGGDGFFTAVDPDNSKVAYEEYTAGDVAVTKDGGKTWTDIDPGLTSPMFSTPFEMDTHNANHLVIGGREVKETTDGPATSAWTTVFDLGTTDGITNQLSAVDTLTNLPAAGAPVSPKTADFAYTAGASTVPGPATQADLGVFVPGTYDDHPFTIGPNDGDAALHAKITWADATINDWDLYLLKAGGTTPIASSAQGGTTSEELALPNPDPGDYVLRIVNYTAVGSVDANVTFDQRTQAIASKGSSSYVGYCGYCDTITQGTPFGNGIATNVGGDKPGLTGSPDGWHIAAAKGLPSRYITSVRMDPENPRTVYVTLAGYGRRWAFPGAVGEDTSKVGTGHVFKSTDAGATFTNVTGNLPDIPANWSLIHNGHLVVGTDIGVFESCDTAGGQYATLGSGLPTSPVSTLRYKPGDPNTILAATYGRGPFTYTFSDDNGRCPAADGSPGTTPTPTPSPTPTSTPNGNGNGDGSGACPASSGFKRARVKPAGAGLRFAITRRVMAAYKVDVFRSAAGRTVGRPVLVKRFRNRTGQFTWKGRAGLPSGIYFTRAKVRSGSTADTRRSVFAYRHGRFHARPQFSARASCKLLGSARLGSPAFGGTSAAPLRIAFRLIKPASVTVRATQGSKTLLGRTLASGAKGYTRLRLPARRAHRGRVVVRISARAGSVRESVRLVSLRL